MKLPSNPKLLPLAKKLRRENTPSEKHLWYDFLNTAPFRFRRQVPIGNYIVDFLCYSSRLVIEVDAGGHFEEVAILNDDERTKYIESLGFLVLRYTNFQVMKEFAEVCEDISANLASRV